LLLWVKMLMQLELWMEKGLRWTELLLRLLQMLSRPEIEDCENLALLDLEKIGVCRSPSVMSFIHSAGAPVKSYLID
jgi:hypothetical protein